MTNNNNEENNLIVNDIMIDTDLDDGLYKGYDRALYCLRCIDHNYLPPGKPKKPNFAYCDNCMNELDRAPYVRMIMRELRRS